MKRWFKVPPSALSTPAPASLCLLLCCLLSSRFLNAAPFRFHSVQSSFLLCFISVHIYSLKCKYHSALCEVFFVVLGFTNFERKNDFLVVDCCTQLLNPTFFRSLSVVHLNSTGNILKFPNFFLLSLPRLPLTFFFFFTFFCLTLLHFVASIS